MARRVSFRGFPAGEPPFPETRLAIGQNHAPQFKLTSMSCMNHAIIKTYQLWNLQCVWQSAPRSHLLVAASLTLIKLNRALYINKKARSRLRQAATRIAVCLQQILKRGIRTSSEIQGQIVGVRESLNGQKNMARRKVKNGEKSPWGQCLTRPVPNGCRRSGF